MSSSDPAQVAPSQNNKETTINDQAGQLDAALIEVLAFVEKLGAKPR